MARRGEAGRDTEEEEERVEERSRAARSGEARKWAVDVRRDTAERSGLQSRHQKGVPARP